MSSAELTCKFCDYKFSRKSNLAKHQKNANYCLDIQSKQSVEEVKAKLPESKRASTSRKMIELEMSLAKALEREKMYLQQIEDLKRQLAAKEDKQHAVTLTAITRPATSTKNTIKNLQLNNLQPITDADLIANLQFLTKDHIQAGASGYAKYALEYPLKGKVMVSDAARRKISWKDESGSLVTDAEGGELSRRFFAVVKEPSLKAIRDLMHDLNERHDLAQDEKDDVQIRICDEMLCRLDDLRREIRRTSEGKPTDLRQDFVKEICVGNPVGAKGGERIEGLPFLAVPAAGHGSPSPGEDDQ
jgi:hypothetical protein